MDRPFAACAPGADGYHRGHPAAVQAHVIDATQGQINLRGRTQFALCGFAEASRPLIPFTDPNWIVCGLNQLYRHIPRADVWFDVHENWREGNLDGTDHVGWLRTCGIPVVMAQVEPEIPTSVAFPLARMAPGYFTSTSAYMVAWVLDHIDREVHAVLAEERGHMTLAEAQTCIMREYGRYTIGMFGIDLVAGGEYEEQRPCTEFWLGRAAARGIAILIPPTCALLKQAARYGTVAASSALVSPAELKARGTQLNEQIQTRLASVERLAGRQEEALYWQHVLEVRAHGGTAPPPPVPE